MLLHNARIILPDRVANRASLIIDDDRIAHIIEPATSELPPSDPVIDLAGHTVLPGFIDAHIHGAVGVDANAAVAGELHEVSRFLAKNGVTAWLPTLVPDSEPNYRKSTAAIDELIRTQNDREPAARVVGVHYEGPYVSDKQCGALRSEFFQTFARGDDLTEWPRLQATGAIHLTTVAPEIEGGIELIKELIKQGWITSIGHTRATVDILNQAFAAGARHMTHFMNAMAPLHHRSPGPVAWGLIREDVTCDIIADGVHIDPLMLQLILKVKGAGRVALISDAIAAAGMGDGDYQIWGETITVDQGRTRNVRGSIAGSVITMLDAVRLLLSLGVSDVDVACMASLNPARLLGRDQECGSIAEGKRADLVALDGQGNVRLTIVGGRVAFQG